MNTSDILLPFLLDDINNWVSMNKCIKLWVTSGLPFRKIVNTFTLSEIKKWNFTRLSIDFSNEIQLFFEYNRLKIIYFDNDSSTNTYSHAIIMNDDKLNILCGFADKNYLCDNNISGFAELAFLICSLVCSHCGSRTKLSDNELIELFSKFKVLNYLFNGSNKHVDLSDIEIEI